MCCMTDNAVGVLEDQSIWHYRQFAEFVAILQNQTLWFSRLDRLRDPFEGRSGREGRLFEKADAHMRKGWLVVGLLPTKNQNSCGTPTLPRSKDGGCGKET